MVGAAAELDLEHLIIPADSNLCRSLVWKSGREVSIAKQKAMIFSCAIWIGLGFGFGFGFGRSALGRGETSTSEEGFDNGPKRGGHGITTFDEKGNLGGAVMCRPSGILKVGRDVHTYEAAAMRYDVAVTSLLRDILLGFRAYAG
ncbi:hypothetical protein DFH09DRAFT_1084437 [Mycena vulgaris]|nr:hypothetical protein DFH09DRAFT_1085872 [Mycena vulgaris]KAJ6556726.1 hypothetical protein DFH09DRAFT_1084437 [Mycena vulgaris]